MEIKFRTSLPILIFYFLEYSLVQAVENVVTYTAKPMEVLECSFTTSVVQWNELRDDGSAIALFSYDVSNAQAINLTSDSKYDNFDYSVEETNGFNGFNLVITNIDKHDGGRYQCSPFSATPQIFSVTVEVLPHFISINCTELNVCTSSAERETAAQIACVCMATGLNSKTLELEWEAIGVLTTSNTTRVMDPTSGTISIRSETTLLPPNGTSSVSCSLTGYESQIPERLRSYTYSFSPPVCNLVHDCTSDGMDAVLTCNCSDGSPKISAYSFYNSQMSPIGTQFYSSSTLKVETDGKVNFYCSGCNGVMHDQIVGYEFNCKQAGSALWIVIIIGGFLLLLVVAAIICFVVKKHWCSKGKGVRPKRKQDGYRDEEHPLYDNTEAQDQKLHDPRSEDPKAIKPDVSTSGCPATKDKDKQFIADDIPEYADVNKGKRLVSSGGGQAPNKDEKGKKLVSLGGGQAPNKDEKHGETDVSQQDHHNGDIGDNVLHSNRGEGNPASTVRPPPEGQETTVNGQSERDVGSEVDHGKRQSEKVVGSHVDSDKWEVDTTETSGGNQLTHPAPSAKQYKSLPQGYNDNIL